MSPEFTAKEPGTYGTSTQSPSGIRTWSPGTSVWARKVMKLASVCGAALALDEERLVQVRLVVGVDVRGPHRVAPQHHVAVVVLVHPQRELGVQGLGVEAPGLAERALDQRLGDAVVHDDEEADVFERAPQRFGGGAERAWPSREIWSEIDHRDHDSASAHVATQHEAQVIAEVRLQPARPVALPRPLPLGR